jgi:hypothetical protein
MIGASIDEWWPETYDQFEIGLDSDEKHSGTRSAYIKSVVSKPTEFGELSQTFVTNNYFGKRIKMSAWVKSRLTSGTTQLWIRVDGEWTTDKPGCFDNMEDRPITGDTNWSQYSQLTFPTTAVTSQLDALLPAQDRFGWMTIV